MKPSIELVREFHEKFGHPIAYAPTEATPELRKLRLDLIAEELSELATALGFQLVNSIEFENLGPPVNLIEAADALGDLDYVVSGANLVFGFPAVAVMEEIHRSNMSKLGVDGKPIYRADGKVLKGPDYSPPDLQEVFRKMTEEAKRDELRHAVAALMRSRGEAAWNAVRVLTGFDHQSVSNEKYEEVLATVKKYT